MSASATSSANCDCSCNSDSPKDWKNYLLPEEPRKNWEKWDLRILVLYILVTQLSLYLLGRHRKVSTNRILMGLSVWLLYLFSDLFATVALGKLSKINIHDNTKHGSNGGQKEQEFTKSNGGNDHPSNAYNDTIDPVSVLRGLWAPIILFYLGGPDSLTVLKLEENEMWTRHLVGLVAQGLRTAYVLFVTFAKSSGLSILALLMIVPGIVKYGERVWVMKSRARGKHEGFVQLDESPGARQGKGNNNSEERALLLKAFSNFQILKPHLPGYECDDKSKLNSLIEDFHARIRSSTDAAAAAAAANSFKLIEIELGFMYDVRFSKVGTIFTVWGCIFRLLTFSCIVGVFVAFFLIKKPGGERLKVDLPITVMLLVGAIFLEVAGVIDQLVSDWAVVWASKYRNILSGTPVFALQEFILSKRQRWSGLMGQFSLLDFCNKYSQTKLHQMIESLCGKEKIWDPKFGLPLSEVDHTLKKLIIHQIIETLPSLSDIETLQTSGMKRGERSLEKCLCQDQFEWSIKLEFTESILVWHVATDICYHSEDPKSVTGDQRAARMLSYYMMHLLLICPPKLPFCKTNDKCFQKEARDDLKKNFVLGSKLRDAEARKQLVEEKQTDSNNTVKHIKKLARDLLEKENKWKIMSFVWVEMLCYAASHCPVKNHVQELRHGGEFLTHVWLLLMHYGVNKELEQDRTDKLQPMGEKALNAGVAEF